MLTLHNTLSGTSEVFTPIEDGKVHMYHCGPTVYDYAHVGNLRSYVFADTLRRVLEEEGYEITQVINITDIGHLSGDGDHGDDKMTRALVREGKPLTLSAMREVADFYFSAFKRDLETLNIKTPTYFPFASDHVKEDIELIQRLQEKGFTYAISDGIYFDTSKDADYGKLGGITAENEEHSRIGINAEKKNSRDFALWKFNDELGYDAPFGKGFPGWHIECSAMAMKYLGETFDIHTGGIDHIPVHHNNEIAQSESATGKPFARFWLHNAFVTIDDGKMAKSEGNFITLRTLTEKNILPLAYRYWLLQARYSSPVNFSFEALEAAQNAYIKILKAYKTLPEGGLANSDYLARFREAVESDLDTPRALALLWELLKDEAVPPEDKKTTVRAFDAVLGLAIEDMSEKTDFVEQKIENLPAHLQELIARREKARADRDFAASDALRNELKEAGYQIEDRPEGPSVSIV